MDGYNQNCARCTGEEGDALFLMRMTNGAQKNGRVLMPKFDGVLPQELL